MINVNILHETPLHVPLNSLPNKCLGNTLPLTKVLIGMHLSGNTYNLPRDLPTIILMHSMKWKDSFHNSSVKKDVYSYIASYTDLHFYAIIPTVFAYFLACHPYILLYF